VRGVVEGRALVDVRRGTDVQKQGVHVVPRRPHVAMPRSLVRPSASRRPRRPSARWLKSCAKSAEAPCARRPAGTVAYHDLDVTTLVGSLLSVPRQYGDFCRRPGSCL
jgi:hypothetical protein